MVGGSSGRLLSIAMLIAPALLPRCHSRDGIASQICRGPAGHQGVRPVPGRAPIRARPAGEKRDPPASPASLTKIMTALIALESAPLQEVVKIDSRALVHHSSYNFRAGEEFLLRDLVTAMLVTSANDACEAVAWHVGGG